MAALSLLLILCIFHHQQLAFALATPSENDMSYMRVVSNATDLPLVSEYDYIVIGGGAAGCPLAATLSQNYSVLLLERGASPAEYPSVFRADQFFPLISRPDDGVGPVDQFTTLDGVDSLRARILGGGTMINGGFYSRAEPEFYNKSGLNWDAALVEEAYRWVEEAIVYQLGQSRWQSVVQNSLLEAGVVPDNGFTLEHLVGTKSSGTIIDTLARRHGAVELLNRGNFGKLRVGVRASVEQILFSRGRSGSLTATGVLFRDSRRRLHRATVKPKGEVILSAGTLGSPQLLLLSGVGPTSDLSSLRIPVVKAHSNVGKFVADNTRNNVAVVLSSPVPPSILTTVGITPDYYIESISTVTLFVPDELTFIFNLALPVNLSIGTFGAKVPGPASQGFLSLASPVDVRVDPRVKFNYFSDPTDLARCVKGVRKIGDMLRTETMAQFKYDRSLAGEAGFQFFGPQLPENYRTNDTAVGQFCRDTITTWWHYHGGCRAGKVVDGEFRVTGIDALRVVDASVYTSSPGTNPMATLMMTGRYVGLRILQQRS